MIKPAIQGVHNVLKACVRAKTVKRVVLTSSAAAVSINRLNGTGLVMDESHWTDVEFLSTEKPPTWVIIKLYQQSFTLNWVGGRKQRRFKMGIFEFSGLSCFQDTGRESSLEIC
jgi:hypothetical protein